MLNLAKTLNFHEYCIQHILFKNYTPNIKVTEDEYVVLFYEKFRNIE